MISPSAKDSPRRSTTPNGGTEIIFQASSLPRNTQLRFPATIESQSSDATLETARGGDITLVSGGIRDRAVYTFISSASSPAVVDEFSFRPVLERTGTPGAGTGFYQVTIGPVGRVSSRVVPRYEEFLLPAVDPGLPPPTTFLFPVERGVDAQSFTVSNTAPGEVLLTIRAFDEDGDLLENADVAGERAQSTRDPAEPDLRPGSHVRPGRDTGNGRFGGDRIQE